MAGDLTVLLCDTLSDILTRDDTPRCLVVAERDIFDFGNSSSQFKEFLDGVKQQQKARFVFGTQFVNISDIVFHHPVYQCTSLEWKAWKLLQMYEPENQGIESLQASPSNLPTFNIFLRNCKETLDKEAYKEIRKCCEQRIASVSRRKSSSRSPLTISVDEKSRKSNPFGFLTLKKEKASTNVTEGTPGKKRNKVEQRKSLHVQTPLPFKRADSSSSLDALDLNSSLNEEIPSSSEESTSPLFVRSCRKMSGRLGAKSALRTLSNIQFKELHPKFKFTATWNDVVDKCTPQLLEVVEGYKIETGGITFPTEKKWENVTTFVEVIDSHVDYSFYEHKIATGPHKNYMGLDGDGNLVLVSISVSKATPSKFVIVHCVDKTYQYVVAGDCKPRDIVKTVPNQLLEYKIGSLTSSRDPELETILIRIEKSYQVKNYKFGVLYCTENQTDENDMFSNNNPSADYLRFLHFLGEEIRLEGWERFRGGLDTKNNTTGTHSVFSVYRGYEIMFHVSTMLPYIENDEQKLERKRHLGNDVAVIVYKEGNTKFDPSCIHSMFNHIFIVIQKEGDTDKYRVEISYKGDIPYPPLPLIPKNSCFSLGETFRTFLLSKLINSERVAMLSSQFHGKLLRTRRMIMEDAKIQFKSTLDSRRRSFG